MTGKELRNAVVESIRTLDRLGFVPARSGNVSVRTEEGTVIVTPSGLDYADMDADDLCLVDLDGNQLVGRFAASTELPMHLGVYRAREDVRCIVHTHARFSTVLACLGQEIPPIHYMLATISRDAAIPLAPYATYGTEELAKSVAAALGADRGGCLLANHGMLAVGTDTVQAVDRAIVLEEVAAVYYHAIVAGTPKILGAEQVAEVAAKIASYGQHKS
jgi:L-fuculose-phosphate aldolase